MGSLTNARRVAGRISGKRVLQIRQENHAVRCGTETEIEARLGQTFRQFGLSVAAGVCTRTRRHEVRSGAELPYHTRAGIALVRAVVMHGENTGSWKYVDGPGGYFGPRKRFGGTLSPKGYRPGQAEDHLSALDTASCLNVVDMDEDSWASLRDDLAGASSGRARDLFLPNAVNAMIDLVLAEIETH